MVSDLLVIQRERTEITFGDVQFEYIPHLESVLYLNCNNTSSNLHVLKWLISFQKVNWLRLCNVVSQMWYWYINTSCLVFILLDSLLVWTPCYSYSSNCNCYLVDFHVSDCKPSWDEFWWKYCLFLPRARHWKIITRNSKSFLSFKLTIHLARIGLGFWLLYIWNI